MQLPDYQRLEQDSQRLVLSLSVREELDCFRGHFEGLPVLAGVVQLDWALRLAEHYWGGPLVFREMVSAKFQQLVRPPVTLTLTLKRRPGQLRYRYENHRGVCSSGAIRLDETGLADGD